MGWGGGVPTAGQGVHSMYGGLGSADIEDYSGQASKGQNGTRLGK